MTPDPGPRRFPTGIDLGTETTVVAVHDGETTRVLDSEADHVGVPTSLSVTDDGVEVGDTGAAASPVNLLPHERRRPSDRSTDDDSETVLLSEFLARVLPDTRADDESGAGEFDGATSLLGGGEPNGDDQGETTAPTVLTVPGAYTFADQQPVARAARVAGFDDPWVVRSPLGVAANELLDPSPDNARTVAVVDIGAAWCDLAVVRGDSEGTIDVLARRSLPNHGRQRFVEYLARWALDRVAARHDVELEVTTAGIAPLVEVADEALAVVDEDDPTTIEVELDDGVDVVEGGWLGAERLSVEVDIDLYACYEALENPIVELQDHLSVVLDAAGVTTEDVDRAVVAGHGTAPTPVIHGVSDFFGQSAVPPSGATRYTASANGAALLAASVADGGAPVGIETFDRTVEVRGLGPDGLGFREVASPRTRADDRPSFQLQTTRPGHDEGYFEVWYRDNLRGSREHAASYVVAGLPRLESTAVVDLTLEFDRHRLSSDHPPTVTAALAPESDPEDWDPAVTVSTDGSGSVPWLADAAVDPTDLGEQRPANERPSAVTVRDPDRVVLAGVSDETLAEVVHDIRNKLWERGVKSGADIESGELATLVREFDSKLASEGVEMVEPSAGEELDSTRHSVATVADADEDEGTILDVEAPGLVVDGRVVRPARVVVAR